MISEETIDVGYRETILLYSSFSGLEHEGTIIDLKTFACENIQNLRGN